MKENLTPDQIRKLEARPTIELEAMRELIAAGYAFTEFGAKTKEGNTPVSIKDMKGDVLLKFFMTPDVFEKYHQKQQTVETIGAEELLQNEEVAKAMENALSKQEFKDRDDKLSPMS